MLLLLFIIILLVVILHLILLLLLEFHVQTLDPIVKIKQIDIKNAELFIFA